METEVVVPFAPGTFSVHRRQSANYPAVPSNSLQKR
jgi:hypothetical protein